MRPRASRFALLLALAALAAAAVPLLGWQHGEATRSRCQSNLRRLGTALFLYAQDYDGCLPPPETPLGGGRWRSWSSVAEPFAANMDIWQCPVNPAEGARELRKGYLYACSYALNGRFHDRFGPGPFPLENLELPEQTALLVEAGRRRRSSPFGPPAGDRAAAVYTDVAEDPLAFPSPHGGMMSIAAADGHVETVRVAAYDGRGHDPVYGRIGASLYNWNGGRPNGQTHLPPRE